MDEENTEKKEVVKETINEEPVPILGKKEKSAKEGSFAPLFFILLVSMVIAFYWDKLLFISKAIHFLFDPTAGSLLNWNLNLGMIIIVFIISIITTLVQKYATDQDTLKELKKEQKDIQKQMKEFKHHPEKSKELFARNSSLMMKQMKLGMRGVAYTGIPFILFFRWFSDFFTMAGNPHFILGLSWFWFYLIFAMIFSSILRKQMDVV